MTIGGWFIFGFVAVILIVIGAALVYSAEGEWWMWLVVAVTIIAVVGFFFGMKWYFNNTASGRRAFVDEKSNLSNGLERTVTVYTADGNILAQYEGKIDVADSDGGYIKFDYDGKRYIYYNCFVETIAKVE